MEKCAAAGLKMTEQRRAIIRALEESDDHPSVEALCQRARKTDASVSVATVYRTLGMLEDLGLVLKHDFRDTSARFEVMLDGHHHHHHHLVDTETGEVVEFQNEEIEHLMHKIAEALGYDMVDHTLEIFGHKARK
jgi:Fur family ferric uptake transcriptional regulator